LGPRIHIQETDREEKEEEENEHKSLFHHQHTPTCGKHRNIKKTFLHLVVQVAERSGDLFIKVGHLLGNSFLSLLWIIELHVRQIVKNMWHGLLDVRIRHMGTLHPIIITTTTTTQ
jgi:hypothetical protein